MNDLNSFPFSFIISISVSLSPGGIKNASLLLVKSFIFEILSLNSLFEHKDGAYDLRSLIPVKGATT